MSRLASAITLCCAVLCAGCGGARGPIAIGWRFADGRLCSDTGASQVLLGGTVACTCGDSGTTCSCKFTCQDGEQGKSVTAELTRSGEITAQAVSPVGGVLYRGVTRVESIGPVTLELYFTGGR